MIHPIFVHKRYKNYDDNINLEYDLDDYKDIILKGY
jgi:hypothetical protein